MTKLIKPRAVFDIEVFRNYFLICFREIDGPRRKHFEFYPGHLLDRQGILRILRNFTLIGFNSINFDVPMMKLALRLDATNEMLKLMCDRIILQNLKPWDVEREFRLPEIPWLDHIDLIEPAPGVQVSLKKYGGRMHSRRLQDLPIEPGAVITAAQRPQLVEYCYNDLQTTIDLYHSIQTELALREAMSDECGIDLRSKSDAQIAEAIIRKEIEAIKGERVYRPELDGAYSFKYKVPSFIEFKSDELRAVVERLSEQTFYLDKNGAPAMPAWLGKQKIKLGETTYQMGIGGLHSTESHSCHFSDDEFEILDSDVNSFYPNIVLKLGIYPEQLGPDFLKVYRRLVEQRLSAKKLAAELKNEIDVVKARIVALENEKWVLDSLRTKLHELEAEHKRQDTMAAVGKIATNASYGKFGSQYSILYSPDLICAVTLTGQLALLMLIEDIELAGIRVVSANTDGIVIKYPRGDKDDLLSIIKAWKKTTGFEMEQTQYAALYSRDVNSYLALKTDGSIKGKGAYAEESLKKDPANQVCIDAVIAYLRDGVPLLDTIEWCPDIRKFLNVRKVTGGALYRDQYLGRVVRWYHARGSTDCIRSMKKGDKVARTDGCKPLMELTGELPNDIDYDHYLREAHTIIADLGVL